MSDNKRREADFYPTPKTLVAKGVSLALERYTDRTSIFPWATRNMSFLDPGCGPDARFAEHADTLCFGDIVGVDIGTDRGIGLSEKPNVSLYWGVDFLDGEDSDWGHPEKYDIICGNPPFSLAEQFVSRCLELVAPEGVVCLLLRLGFWESQARVPLLTEFPPAMTYVLSQRPSFYSDSGIGKTDGTAYAYFVWDGRVVRKIHKSLGISPGINILSWRGNPKKCEGGPSALQNRIKIPQILSRMHGC